MTLEKILESLKAIRVIQGGMGVYISNPTLARTVSILGGLGTLSGVALEHILALKLQAGDPGGHIRRVLQEFPFQNVVKNILDSYYIEEGGKKSHRGIPMYSVNPSEILISLIICANFAFVKLAKEGHNGLISINYLTKIEMPQIFATLGALMGGVDVITMGAGIPMNIPPLINALIEGQVAEYPITIQGQKEKFIMTFDPKKFFGDKLPPMQKPAFIPIITADSLAKILHKKLGNEISGFVIETDIAGGHNAPPRGQLKLDKNGDPIYGDRDKTDFAEIAKLGLPFWIGGGYGTKDGLTRARALKATGIQVGTLFALCEESGMAKENKDWLLKCCFRNTLEVRTSPTASPTGFPFKVAQMAGSLSGDAQYLSRKRACDKGVLRSPYKRPDGTTIDYRCPAEPVNKYLKKGGNLGETVDVRCVCNGLVANTNVGFGYKEFPIVTLGDTVEPVKELMLNENSSYSAGDVMEFLL